MKKIFPLILLLSLNLPVFCADSNWKIFPIFDEAVKHVVETPDYVYFTSLNMMDNPSNSVSSSLFRYDKKGEELMPLSKSNILNGNNVTDMIYNPGKGYLAVLYDDYNVDFIFNNGKVINLPSYSQTSLMYSKKVNSMAIDKSEDRLYLATDFGYIALNDKKYEVAESRIYNSPFQSFCRLGNSYLALQGNDLLMASASEPRLSLSDYKKLETFTAPKYLYPLNDNTCLLFYGANSNMGVKKLTLTGGQLKTEDLFTANIYNIENNPTGVTVATNNKVYQFNTDGSYTSIDRPESYNNSAAATLNMSELWNGLARKGLSSVKKTGETWSVTRNWMMPNAPATFITTSFASHPSKGLLLLSHGYLPSTSRFYTDSPMELSAYKQGRWTNLAPAYTNPERTNMITASNGLAIDPDNNNYVYISSYHNGFVRLNLNDPKDIIHYSRATDPDAQNEGFVVLTPTPATHSSYANIMAPLFDKSGNLWMYYADWDDQEDPNPHFYCLLAEDRKATTNSKNARLPKAVELQERFPISNLAFCLPLLKSGKGTIAYIGSQYEEELCLWETNGTPLDPNDDKVYRFSSLTDTDGNKVDVSLARYMWEDPSTGNVWICHQNGVCYFNPTQVFSGNYFVNRVKVPRNDGTNLADYLLEGVDVNMVTSDGDGRKWFSTNGGGLICTSSDGREILEEFTSSNSLLPSDVVFGVGYNPDNNSLMISTEKGYVEYSLPVTQDTSSKADVKAYPNPVRPQYSGYVTITDIPQGSFVKITDSVGNLVKELGIVSGFEILWDISDSNFNRVKSGVYHIMVSPSNENSSYSAVGKILVMS